MKVLLSLLLSLFVIAFPLYSQITVPGLTGLNLTIGDSDYQLSVTDPFGFNGVRFVPTSQGLTVQFTASESLFSMWGEGIAVIGTDSIPVQFGTDASSAGLTFFTDRLDRFQLAITKEWVMSGLTINPESVGFVWDETQFSGFGLVKIALQGNSVSANLGTAENPGLIVTDGAISLLDFSLTDFFDFGGLGIQPKQVRLRLSDTTTFELWGEAMLNVSNDSVLVRIGTENQAGATVENGRFASFLATIIAEFSLLGESFIPKNLTVGYKKTETESDFELGGEAVFKVGADTISIALVNEDGNPGIVISNGVITTFVAQITGEFQLKSLRFRAQSLELVKQAETSRITGSASLYVATDSLSLSLIQDGILIENGTLEQINASVSGAFTLANLSLVPENVITTYVKSSEALHVGGTLTTTLDNETVSATLGTVDNSSITKPGLVLKNGQIQLLEIGITSDLTLKNITMRNRNLTLRYDQHRHDYQLFGDVSILAGPDSVHVSLGTSSAPGVVVQNGQLQDFDLAITGVFHLGGLQITPEALEFEYQASSDRFDIYGSATVALDANPVKIALGTKENPGLEIANKNLTRFNASVTADFTLKAVTFKPQSLGMSYVQAGKKYAIYGTALVEFEQESLSVTVGTQSAPGIALENGTLMHINLAFTSLFTVRGASFRSKNLGFSYDFDSESYEMWGTATMKIETDSLGVDFGLNENPGLIIQNGALDHLSLNVNSNFHLKGLQFSTQQLRVDWDKTRAKRALAMAKKSPKGVVIYDSYLLSETSVLKISGSASLTIGGENIAVKLGEGDGYSVPGIEITNGALTEIDVFVSSDIKIGMAELKVNQANIKHENNKWEFIGEVLLTQIFSTDVKFGDGSQPGIEITTTGGSAHFRVDNLKIDVQQVNLGTFNLNELLVEIENGKFKDAEIDVLFPGGMEFDGRIEFDEQSHIKAVSIDYKAQTVEAAIPLPGGGHIIELGGGLDNLDRPADIVFSGKIAIVYGGPMTLDGVEVTLLYLGSNGTIDRTGFSLTETVFVGAYEQNGVWKSKIAQAQGKLELKFGQYFMFESEIDIPSDPKVVVVKSALYMDPTHISGFIKADLYAPKEVPFVGGKLLAEVDGAFQYFNKNLNRSFAAAWLEFDPSGLDVVVGARYNFGTKHIDILGSDEVDNITTSTSSSSTHPKGTGVGGSVFSFNVKSPLPQALILDMKFPGKSFNAMAWVTGPEDDEYEMYVMTDKYVSSSSRYTIDGHWITPYSTGTTYYDSVKIYVIDRAGHKGSTIKINGQSFTYGTSSKGQFIPGKYSISFLTTNYLNPNAPDPKTFDFKMHQFYVPPAMGLYVSNFSNNQLNLTAYYYSLRPHQTNIQLYANEKDKPSSSYLLADRIPYNPMPAYGNVIGESFLKVDMSVLPVGKTYEVFGMITDSLNSPVQTIKYGSYVVHGKVRGALILGQGVTGSKTGYLFYIDENNNGKFDMANSKTGKPAEKFVYSNEFGAFDFPDITPGTYSVGVVLPPGLELASNSPVRKDENGKWLSYTYKDSEVYLTTLIELSR